MSKMVSIIMPAYNSEQTISIAIQSVASQKYPNIQLIIVDDYSTDNTRSIISESAKKDSSILPVFLDENVGPAQARNIGLRYATGYYVGFLDSDDKWVRGRLKIQVQFMENQGIALCFGAFNYMTEEGDVIQKVIRVPSRVNYYEYLKYAGFNIDTILYRREEIGELEFEDTSIGEDYSLWLPVLQRGIMAYGLDEPLALYRISSRGRSVNKLHAFINRWRVYNHLGLSRIKKAELSIGYAIDGIRKNLTKYCILMRVNK